MRNLNYDLSCWDGVPHQSTAEAIVEFLSTYTGHCFSNQLKLSVNDSFTNLVNIVLDAFASQSVTDLKVMCYSSRSATIIASNMLIAMDDSNQSNADLWTVYDRSIVIDSFGDCQMLEKISTYLRTHIIQRTVPTVHWEYMVEGERDSQEIKIAPAKPISNEFYPWIGGDVYEYFEKYIASDASILVLLGETGTAKTSFIRSMIWHCNLNTKFTYEEELLSTHSMFVDFLVNDRTHLLVVEDADLFLTSREHDGNKIMSKFLNVSDGLASVGRKKMIFTANITEPSRIDNALLRAGRCFDCQIFRRLSYKEACAAAKVADIPVPTKDQGYTLAELFALSKNVKARCLPDEGWLRSVKV